MAKRATVCRVCGKQFVPCNKSSASLGAFNYHSIACSAECGVEYLRRVQDARQQTEQTNLTELEGQLSMVKDIEVNAAGEISEDVAEKDDKTEPKTYCSRKNKQETNEEE